MLLAASYPNQADQEAALRRMLDSAMLMLVAAVLGTGRWAAQQALRAVTLHRDGAVPSSRHAVAATAAESMVRHLFAAACAKRMPAPPTLPRAFPCVWRGIR